MQFAFVSTRKGRVLKWILFAIISRYCYKSDISKRIYAWNGRGYARLVNTDSVSAHRRGERAITFRAGLVPQISSKTKNALFLICAYATKFLGKTKRASPLKDGGAGSKSLRGKSLLPQKASIHAGLRVIGKSGKRFFLTFSKNVLCIKIFWKSFWRFYFCLLPPSKNGHF